MLDSITSEEDVTAQCPPAKRRKVRKGTQSCWTCKRRKVRCIFSVATNAVCDNCVKRKTQCISQEYPDVKDSTSYGHEYALGVEDRLSRVEDILQTLIHDKTTSHSSPDPRRTISHKSLPRVEVHSGLEKPSWIQESDVAANDPVTTIPTPLSSVTFLDGGLESQYTGLAQELVAAWPCKANFDAICKLPICLSTHTHMHLCTPPSAKYNLTETSTREMLQLPPPGSHPVLVGRKLLFLGSLLQGALSASPSQSNTDISSTKLKGIMSTAINAAISLVTTNDALTGSVEGVECIMIEAMIHNYTGNLHRAWLSVRRGIAVAQMIGLDRVSKAKILDPITKNGFDAECFCYRIVEMERYLSLTLGLAPSSFTSKSLSSQALEACQGMDRLARMHCIIAEKLLRNHGAVRPPCQSGDLQGMENLLNQAANEMTPQWWLIPEMSSNCIKGDSNPFHEVGRLNYQFSHYHLVMRLHLSYMLRSSNYDDSKIAAANASREVLLRYIAFRRWNPGHFYCRGTDFLAFMAVVVLCLAHISSRSYQHVEKRSSTGKIIRSSRMSDRGMMERTVDILETMREDATATKLVRMMKHILDVELDALQGVAYKTVASEREQDQAEYEGGFVNGRATLQLHIPYMGTIDLHKKLYPETLVPLGNADQVAVDTTLPGIPSTGSWSQEAFPSDLDWSLQEEDPDFAAMLDSAQFLSGPGDLTLQSINESLFSSLFDGMDDSITAYNV